MSDIRTHAANQAYRDGWDRIFARSIRAGDIVTIPLKESPYSGEAIAAHVDTERGMLVWMTSTPVWDTDVGTVELSKAVIRERCSDAFHQKVSKIAKENDLIAETVRKLGA